MDKFSLRLQYKKRYFPAIPPVWNIEYRKESIPWMHSVSDSFQFCFRFAGTRPSLKCTLNGVKHEEPYPHLQVKRPGDVYDLEDLEDKSEVLYYTYKPEYESFFDNCGIPKELDFYSLRDMDCIIPVMKRLFHAVENCENSGMYDQIDLCCLEMVQTFFAEYRHSQEPVTPSEQRLRNIASFFQLNYDQSIDFEALAKRFGFSMRTFTRHWKKHFNTSPAQYLLNLKLE